MILLIIQARMGSKRLPGKVMLPLAGIPDIYHVYSRVVSSNKVNNVVVAQLVMHWLGVHSTLRASFYLYNTPEDVNALIEGLKETIAFFKGDTP